MKLEEKKLSTLNDDFPLGNQGPLSQKPELKWEAQPIKVVNLDSEMSPLPRKRG